MRQQLGNNKKQHTSATSLLDFWFVCKGFREKLSSNDSATVERCARAIYRKYLDPSGIANLEGFSAELRNSILESVKLFTTPNATIDQNIFVGLQTIVLDILNNKLSQFLQSECVKRYVSKSSESEFELASSEVMSRTGSIGDEKDIDGLLDVASNSKDVEQCRSGAKFGAAFVAKTRVIPSTENLVRPDSGTSFYNEMQKSVERSKRKVEFYDNCMQSVSLTNEDATLITDNRQLPSLRRKTLSAASVQK